MSSRKQKRKKSSTAEKDNDDDDTWTPKTKMKINSSSAICIIHAEDSKYGNFTILTDKTKDSVKAKLKDIAEKRLQQEFGSAHRMEPICTAFLADYDNITENTHGYHRGCYTKFTAHLDRLKNIDTDDNSENTLRRSQRSHVDVENIIFNPDCIFCNKTGRISVIKDGLKTTEGLSNFDKDGGPYIQNLAEEVGDTKLVTRIKGYNLFSSEAKYHPSCRLAYKNKNKKRSSYGNSTEESRNWQALMEEAHTSAFEKVIEMIESQIIKKQVIMKLYIILGVYRDNLRGTAFENDHYRAEKLIKRIKKNDTLSKKISFCFPHKDHKRYETCLVYSNDMKMEDAVRASFELGMALSDKVKETAIEIRGHILEAFKKHSESSHWPPNPETLSNYEHLIPDTLKTFMKILISGSTHSKSDKMSRLMFSISQDICRAATQGKWNLPKHILLGMALRHLFRSAEVTVILNRFGHIPDYCFMLELETALAKALDESSHLLTNNIVRNPSCMSVFHSDFDNFDQYTNELTGAGSVHRAYGIMLQEFLPEVDGSIGGTTPHIQPQTKTKERSYKFKQSKAPEENLYMGIRKNPPMKIHTTDITGGEGQRDLMLLESLIWVFLRLTTSENGIQVYPGWSGYISILGTSPTCLTTIDYYPVIPYPITDYSTVKETLRFAEEAGNEVGQEYHIVTYDLGVCFKAYPLIWNHPGKYKKHIVLIGTFHIVCAYMKMMAKKMKGSGFSDILIESGLMTSGSMVSVLSGKGYSRAMNCHKSLVEGLERLLMNKFFKCADEDITSKVESAKQLILIQKTKPGSDVKTLVSNENVRNVISAFKEYRTKVKSGSIGVTARLWVSYMDHVWLMLSLLHAVKTNNYLEYACCMTLLPDLFFSFGGQNYARYLTYFSVFLANIDHSHPGALDLIKRGVFSVARSFVPDSRSATDKTIEETFMKHSKSRGGSGGTGMIGILHNEDAYQRWVRTARERVKFYQAALQMAGMEPNNITNKEHKENRLSEIKKSANFITQVVETIEDYGSPFDSSDENKLYCLSSGCPVTEDIMEDVLKADDEGEKAKLEFIKERLGEKNYGKKGKNGEGIFFDTIKKMKLKTMSSNNAKVTLTKSNTNTVKYRQDGSFVFNLLVQLEKMGPGVVNVREFVSYPLTPIVYSIGTLDGFLAKTNKSKGFQWLTSNTENAKYPKSNERTIVIEDGNAIFHCMSNVPSTFLEIAERIFDMASSCDNIIFSTDMYKRNSVKTMERLRRGTSNKLLIGGPKTKKPYDWKDFLKNDDNKKRLIELLLEVWSSNQFSSRLIEREVTLICEGKAFKLNSSNHVVTQSEISEIESTQEETDTRVILYCLHTREKGFKNVIVRSPDSDIFFILLSYIHSLNGITVYFDTGKKNKKRLINISELGTHYSDEYCKALLGIHVFTGCDSTSAFKGKGKVRAIKWMLKDDLILKAAAALGNEWVLSDEIIAGLERLTCRLYGTPRVNEVDECRYNKLVSVCCAEDLNVVHPTKKFDTAFIPPAKVSLIEHCKRVNFEVGKCKRSHEQFPFIPSPFDNNGWGTDENNAIRPIWFQGNMLPQNIINELPSEPDTNDNDDEQDEDEGEEEETVNEDDFSDFIAELFNESDEEDEFEGFSDLDDE